MLFRIDVKKNTIKWKLPDGIRQRPALFIILIVRILLFKLDILFWWK